ncbi:MAG: hypothetical protein J6J16_09080 [Lachnospiraceae bacterium]|nr:hypothetical protein [Lachnospiraceae bacterium]
MSIYEYDEELHIKTMMEIGSEEGYETGIREGLETGIQGTIAVMKNMKLSNEDIIKQLMTVYTITENEAMSYIRQL